METITVSTQHSAGYWGPMLGVYGRPDVFHADPATILTADDLTITVRDGRAFYRIGNGDAGEVTGDHPATATTHDEIVAFWTRRIVELAQLRREILAGQPNTDPEPPATAALPEDTIVNIPVTEGSDGRIHVGGYDVVAPTFRDADQFDRALGRAFMDGLRVEATDRRDMVLVVNPNHGTSYTTSRRSCSCTAGQRGVACKHVALCVFLADVLGELPSPAGKAA